MTAVFPSDETLLGWLDHEPARLDDHLREFPADFDRLDQLTALSAGLKSRLDEALVVPEELALRIRTMIQGDVPRREAGKLLFEALKTPWDVASLIWNDERLT